MNKLMAILIVFVSAGAAAEPVALKYDTACVFQAVAAKMKITPRADLDLPRVSLASQTDLKDFQDVIAEEWSGYRPDVITNVFAPKTNRIFLTDEKSAYQPYGRYLDDSLAHELAHYVQVVYKGATAGDDDALETEAVRVQTWVRETFLARGVSPCEADPQYSAF